MSHPLIGVVGVCGSGKSTLISGLKIIGVNAKHIAQEHSFVKDMWKRITNPDILVYLDVSFEVASQRRKMDWNNTDFEEQQRRLRHARGSADIIINTNELKPEEVLKKVLLELQNFQ